MHRIDGNGANLPAIGFGTWTLEGDSATRLVSHALQVGYRHIDTAAMYQNEKASRLDGIALSNFRRSG